MSVSRHRYYRLYDPDPTQGGAIEIERADAKTWNEKNWGIFWSVNSFSGARRKDSLLRINAFTVDLDSGSKKDQLQIIGKGLVPSLVVETKKGHHVYFLAKDATAEGYRSILTDRLCPFYNGDLRATDLCRILRVPDFFHCKDPNDRFQVRTVHRYPVAYTERDLCLFYPASKESLERDRKKTQFRSAFTKDVASSSDSLWQKVWDMDCEQALLRLSGHQSVGGETFGFNPVATGNLNILVNNQSTSCWVDREKRIGSLDGGGPTVFNWINWYQESAKKTVQYMREVFPELWSTNQ